jgi:hypothetical protein
MHKYKKGMVLIFIKDESNDSHAKNFTKGNHYTISDISDYDDYNPEAEYRSGYNKVISFKDSRYGCFTEFADMNFTILQDHRDATIRNILE